MQGGLAVWCREGFVGVREHAGGEFDNGHGTVLDTFLFVAEREELLFASDALRVFLKDEAEQVGLMDEHIEDDTCSCLGCVESPCFQMFSHQEGVVEAESYGFSYLAVAENIFYELDAFGATQVVVCGKDDAVVLRCFHDVLRVGERCCEGFFA